MIISLLFSEPILFFAIFIALIISISFHEFFHVFTARLLGDRTGEYAGRLTLNPLVHLDPFGTIAILLIGFGWGKPAPFNPYNLKNQRYGPALVALGGPTSNLILIIIFGIILKILYPFFGPESYLTIFLQVLVTFNGVLMVFNLIPIPPLDGSHILEGVLGSRFSRFTNFLNAYGPRI
ncbi:site-2 protease family protein, partial [Patescibacteria group bacterium]|nr:site-2 protease family protein [Patescibacteria group bacterium]